MEGDGMDDKVLQKVVAGLAKEPAFLALFALCVLLFGGGTATGVVGIIAKEPAAQYVGLLLGVASLIALVAVVFIISNKGKGIPEGKTGNADFDPKLDEIYKNIRFALGKTHKVFQNRMKKECDEFVRATSHWAAGELRATGDIYDEILVHAYESAEREVVATSSLDYSGIWKDYLGDAVLRAHKASKAKVTRIFLFSDLKNVPEELIAEMEKQVESGHVNVRVYGDKEYIGSPFPPNFNQDFAFIDDGDIIVSTDPARGEDATGTFYFKDAGKKAAYKAVVDELTSQNASKDFDDFMKGRNPSWVPKRPKNDVVPLRPTGSN
jgi:hypothetical protein